MLSNEVLSEAFSRIHGVVHSVLDGANIEVLTYRADAEPNTIAWLVWHLSRGQDDHIAELMSVEQVWISGGWLDRFDLPFEPGATGYGQSADDVAHVRADAELLVQYYDAVHTRTIDYVNSLEEADYARVVDKSWNPPVTLAAAGQHPCR